MARALRRAASRLDSVLVYTAGAIPPGPYAELPSGHWIEEMDPQDMTDIARWIALYKDAFGRDVGPAGYRSAILDHPHYELVRTAFIVDSQGPVAVMSSCVFRRNPEIGVGHYFAVAPRAQARGLGKVLSGEHARTLTARGVWRAEMETQITRPASIKLGFGFGYEPKYKPDEWNTPDQAGRIFRAAANVRLWRLYRSYRASHPGLGARGG
jgi:GNAT superfamily N-acetyltransferase